jgi:hypothetical protein
MAGSRPFIGVSPPGALARRARLFAALGQLLDVQFGPWPAGAGEQPAALITWGQAAPAQHEHPELVIESDEWRPGDRRSVRLGDEPLDLRLRGLRLEAVAPLALKVFPGEQVLAQADADAVWVRQARPPIRHRVGFGPADLAPGERLRDRLIEDRRAELLPILEFLRHELAGVPRWREPAPRACFLIDDPNLHWHTYGHLNFAELARAGAIHGFHVSIATVPLDGWFVHPGARSIFASQPDLLSLIVHGSEHVRAELGRPRELAAALPVARSALFRIRRMEARSGLSVGRVMAPPHGVCSEPMAAALRLAGFEALTANSRYPWLDRPPAEEPLSGVAAAEFVAGGLPVLERQPLWTDITELALRSYLGHPLILYGHHRDLAGGPESLAEIAGALRGRGVRQWLSPQRIARGNFSVYRQGTRIHVRLRSRRVDLQVPAGVEELEVELPDHRWLQHEQLFCDGQQLIAGEQAAVAPGSHCQLRLVAGGAEAEPDASTPLRAWPIARRGLAEARDRALAIGDRARAAARRARP